MQALIKELKALLEKHNATISFDCAECSDLHGIYDERMEISKGHPDNSNRHELQIPGWSIDASDL